jgi:hypothetical protein
MKPVFLSIKICILTRNVDNGVDNTPADPEAQRCPLSRGGGGSKTYRLLKCVVRFFELYFFLLTRGSILHYFYEAW